jgi:hypothetical protein
MLRRLTLGTRKKLIALVAASDFGNRQYPNKEAWMPVCEALGITPELLREAVTMHRSLSVFNNPDHTDQIMIRVTVSFKAEVKAFCRERRWKMMPLIWTLANEYLHDVVEPKNLIVGRRSRKSGEIVCPVGPDGTCINVRFTPALRHAINLRAANVGATMTGILRGLLTDVMTGERPPPIRLLLRRELQAHADYVVPTALACDPEAFSRSSRRESIVDDGALTGDADEMPLETG